MVYANFDPHEGNAVPTETTITFEFRSRDVKIANDSSGNPLSFKFNPRENFGTIKPYEDVEFEDLWIDRVIIKGNGPYRIWSLG